MGAVCAPGAVLTGPPAPPAPPPQDDYYYDYYDDYAMDDLVGCTMDGTKVKLANGTAPCDLSITGVDKKATLLAGGIDGVYVLSSCHNSKPLYIRKKSPAGEDRVLWYSNSFGDWDISKGTTPNEAEILMYGGEVEHASVPLFVSNWHLGADLAANSSMGIDDYMPVSLAIKCADGTVSTGGVDQGGCQGGRLLRLAPAQSGHPAARVLGRPAACRCPSGPTAAAAAAAWHSGR